MVVTNHATPTTAIGIAYFFPTVTSVVGTTSPQKETAAQIGGIANAMPTPHNNMRTTVRLAMFFLIKLFIGFIRHPFLNIGGLTDQPNPPLVPNPPWDS